MNRKNFYIKLNNADEVKNFNAKICTMDGNYDLSSGRYVIDAKSILGIFSLDLSKEILLTVHNAEELEEMKEKVGQYITREADI